MEYKLTHIASIVDAKFHQQVSDALIDNLLIDSRKIYSADASLFFALKGPRRDGHSFIPELYKRGIRNFLISETISVNTFPEANFLKVPDTLEALQRLAAYHRKQFNIPVIGITGSNGKTIVKEWLYQMLHRKFNIVRSPKSYNSQIGVPLSVWQMNKHHDLAIFEAGISKPGEMDYLEKIVQPTIGILTNIGEAHSENFSNREDKLKEKLKLFVHANKVVAGGDDAWITRQMVKTEMKNFFWGRNASADLRIFDIDKKDWQTDINAGHGADRFAFTIPFTDDASIDNAITCCAVMLAAGIDRKYIEEQMPLLQPVSMRLELVKGINQCSIINDSYSADLSSLNIALNFLDRQSHDSKRTVVLSDFLQTGLSDVKLYDEIGSLLRGHRINHVIGIGKNISKFLTITAQTTYQFYSTTEEFLQQFRSSQFKEEAILIKGARVFEFERIVHALEQKVHETVLEINLNAIAHNLREYQKFLKPSTKLMAMVKAFAYGSGGSEIAGILQFHQVDYLAVAYTDEGVELRRAGITLPVMIMNPEVTSFNAIMENNLEPDLYSFELLQHFKTYLESAGVPQYPIHIEIETGMNRLGFNVDDMGQLASLLDQTSVFKVKSVFSHLAASEEAAQDAFTMDQYERFAAAAERLEELLGYPVIKHIANSAAILRLPPLQMDMVRLGIGMYGVDAIQNESVTLETVATLKSTIAQLKHLHPGESVSYNRRAVITRPSVVATVRIGYADGYVRKLGNSKGQMLVNGQLAPVIGTICMDMTMIDVTDIEGVKEGDEVVVFGSYPTIQQVADWADTIPYEIMTGISQRVKRVYFEE